MSASKQVSAKNLFNHKYRGLAMIAGAVATGIIFDSAPGHAVLKVNMRILATPTNALNDSSFDNSIVYSFSTRITDNIASSGSPSGASGTSWGVTSGSSKLFDFLSIRGCMNPECTSGFVPVTGTWNSSTTITDLQKFAVEPSGGSFSANPSFSGSFGASMGSTGITAMVMSGVTAPMSNLQFGNLFGLTPVIPSDSSITWNAAPPATTALNIIQNLNLANYGSNLTITPNTAGNHMLMSFDGDPTTISFNVNSIRFERVPGPLPVAGSLIAFGYSRKLRKRIRSNSSIA
jgi:hypothetical protein